MPGGVLPPEAVAAMAKIRLHTGESKITLIKRLLLQEAASISPSPLVRAE